ncbi:sigma-54-dependent Fis family transcriptional regulator [candidate division KSB1 bacterium]|nr:sigma-54-dependent Fis family transcriptional regulator [candidate division KSB1 bacterium]
MKRTDSTIEHFLSETTRNVAGITRAEAGVCYLVTAPDIFKIAFVTGLNNKDDFEGLTITRANIENSVDDILQPQLFLGSPAVFSQIEEKSPLQSYTFETRLCLPLSNRKKLIAFIEILNPKSTTLIKSRKSIKSLFSLVMGSFESKMQNREFEESSSQLIDAGLRPGKSKVIGHSKAINDLKQIVEKIASTDATVLLRGETGTGKNIIAQSIHEQSTRSNMPFVKVSCAAIPENLLESELFGHEKGSFTGAIQQRIGRFERAHLGTIFLDEIGEVSQTIQVKLLNVLQYQEFERLGGSHTIKVNTRIIAATNKDLEAAVASGDFRDDLYYRLNVVPVTIAPLRDRIEDIVPLSQFFINRINQKLNLRHRSVKKETLFLLQQYHWPGNIRELENIIERALVIGEGPDIDPKDLPQELFGIVGELRKPKADFTMREGNQSLWEIEAGIIHRALDQLNWNQSKTARSLGITRNHLRYRIKKYGIKREESQ